VHGFKVGLGIGAALLVCLFLLQAGGRSDNMTFAWSEVFLWWIGAWIIGCVLVQRLSTRTSVASYLAVAPGVVAPGVILGSPFGMVILPLTIMLAILLWVMKGA